MEVLFGSLIACIVIFVVLGGVISGIKEGIDNKHYEEFLRDNPEARKLLEEET